MIRASEVRLAQAPTTPINEEKIFNILSVEELKREVRRRDASEDAKFEDAIKEAYFRLDGPLGWLNRAILEQQWKGVVGRFDDTIELPLPPLSSVDLVRYRDEEGSWQTLSTDIYTVSTYGLFGAIHRRPQAAFPAISREPDSVEITFTCGYKDANAVLANLNGVRRALKLLAGHYSHTPLPTFSEPRTLEVPRKVQYALDFVIQQIRIVNDHS